MEVSYQWGAHLAEIISDLFDATSYIFSLLPKVYYHLYWVTTTIIKITFIRFRTVGSYLTDANNGFKISWRDLAKSGD